MNDFGEMDGKIRNGKNNLKLLKKETLWNNREPRYVICGIPMIENNEEICLLTKRVAD